jgi:hypothetical protein
MMKMSREIRKTRRTSGIIVTSETLNFSKLKKTSSLTKTLEFPRAFSTLGPVKVCTKLRTCEFTPNNRMRSCQNLFTSDHKATRSGICHR